MRNFLAFTCAGLVIVLSGIVASQPTSQKQYFNPALSVYGQAMADPSTATASPLVTATLQPTRAALGGSIGDWTTYTNSIVGFSIAYPSTMQLETYRQVVDAHGLDPIFFLCDYTSPNTSLVICFYLPKGIYPGETDNNFARASLAISTSNLGPQDCLSFADNKFDASRGFLSHETIDGISFDTLETHDEELDEWSTNSRSRTFVHNTCVELARTIARTHFKYMAGTVTPPAVPASDPNYQFVQAIFDQMLATFRATVPGPIVSTANPTALVTLSATTTPIPGWTTYTNSVFSFSIAYPNTMQLENFRQVAKNGGFDWIPLCNYGNEGEFTNSSLIICFYLPRGTYPDTTNTTFTGASIAISTTNLNEQDCLSYSDLSFPGFIGSGVEPPKPYQIIINGISFSRLESVGVGTGHFGRDIRNRTFVHNTCFELLTTIAGMTSMDFVKTSTPGITTTPVPDYQNFQALLDQVLATFRFTS